MKRTVELNKRKYSSNYSMTLCREYFVAPPIYKGTKNLIYMNMTHTSLIL